MREAMPRKKKEQSKSVPEKAKPKASSVKKTAAKSSARPKKAAVQLPPAASRPASSRVKKTPLRRPPQVEVETLQEPKKSPKARSNKAEPFLVATSSFKPLPRNGETQLVAFVRDPQCVFTYWEITPQRLEEVKKELREEFKDSFMVLRLYRVEPNGDRFLFDEIRVEPEQVNHYVDIEPTGGTYVIEIARKTSSGRVVAYVASRPVVTGSASLNVADPTPFIVQKAAEDGMAPAMAAYFEEQGYDDPIQTTVGLSSAQTALGRGLRRSAKGKGPWSSFF